MSVTFDKTPTDMKNLASFVAQLVKECVTFDMRDLKDQVVVTLTVGF